MEDYDKVAVRDFLPKPYPPHEKVINSDTAIMIYDLDGIFSQDPLGSLSQSRENIVD
jgi:hypothetical protein